MDRRCVAREIGEDGVIWSCLNVSGLCAEQAAHIAASKCHSPGTPFKVSVPRSSNLRPDPATKSLTVLETNTWSAAAKAPILARYAQRCHRGFHLLPRTFRRERQLYPVLPVFLTQTLKATGTRSGGRVCPSDRICARVLRRIV